MKWDGPIFDKVQLITVSTNARGTVVEFEIEQIHSLNELSMKITH